MSFEEREVIALERAADALEALVELAVVSVDCPVCGSRRAAEAARKRKQRGRPKGDQPWIKAGVSRRTYYRQREKV
jgi:hypothetical protein